MCMLSDGIVYDFKELKSININDIGRPYLTYIPFFNHNFKVSVCLSVLNQAYLKAASFPLVLPSLAKGVPSEVPALLQEALGTPPLYTDPSSLAQQSMLTTPALLVIGLPYSSG